MKKTFRLFVSSTFSDFQNERELLQLEVFPKINKYCNDKGFQFQPIDLRWGINVEAQLDQKTVQICIDEVKASKQYPHPNFFIMLGNRYGWIPLPYMIKKDEFAEILNIVPKKNNLILNNWYKLDFNQLPASYILKERKNEFIKNDIWEKEESIIRNILQDAVNQLDFSEYDLEKYFASATEHEAKYGLYKSNVYSFKENHSDSDYVLSYIREEGNEDEKRLKDLKNNIKKLLSPTNIIKPSSTDIFTNTVFSKLKSMIDAQIKIIDDLDEDKKEYLEHQKFKNERLEVFIGHESVLDTIQQFVNGISRTPLIIYGQSGIGKSSLMANAIEKIHNKKIVYRFIGASEQSYQLRHLLTSICNELAQERIEYELNEDKFYKLIHDFLLGIQEEVIIFIDAMDQVSGRNISWLPKQLPQNVKIIILTLKDNNYKDDNYYYTILNKKYPSSSFLELESLAVKNKIDIIIQLLKQRSRTLTKEQQEYIALLPKIHDITPLGLQVMVNTLQEVSSYNDIGILSLDNTTEEQIKIFFDELIDHHYHEKVLVENFFNYLTASKNGLSETEIIELLSLEKNVKEALENNFSKIEKIPLIAWTRLYYSLKNFLTFKIINDVVVINFFHREFKYISDLYFCQKDKNILHNKMINYFKNKNHKRDILELLHHLYESKLYAELFVKLMDIQNLIYLIDTSYNDTSMYSESTEKVEELFQNILVYPEYMSTENYIAVLKKASDYLSSSGIHEELNVKYNETILELNGDNDLIKASSYSYLCVNLLKEKDFSKATEFSKNVYLIYSDLYEKDDYIVKKSFLLFTKIADIYKQVVDPRREYEYVCLDCGHRWKSIYEDVFYCLSCDSENSRIENIKDISYSDLGEITILINDALNIQAYEIENLNINNYYQEIKYSDDDLRASNALDVNAYSYADNNNMNSQTVIKSDTKEIDEFAWELYKKSYLETPLKKEIKKKVKKVFSDYNVKIKKAQKRKKKKKSKWLDK